MDSAKGIVPSDPPESTRVAEELSEQPTVANQRSPSKVLDAGLRRSMDQLQEMEEGPKRPSTRPNKSSKVCPESTDKLEGVVSLAQAGSMSEKESLFMIKPNAPFLQGFDGAVVMALIFTALVTPYEVSLLETSLNPLFVVNRFIDVLFVIDMGMQLMVIQEVQTPDGTVIIKTRSGLAKRYLRGWFCIDFVSILPFDVMGVLFGSGAISKLKSVRLVRLARLLKLLRIARASRIITRWQTRISLSFSVQRIFSLFSGLLVVSHWMACIWALVGKSAKDNGDRCWIDVLDESKDGYQMDSHWFIYLAASHVSVTTIKATHGLAFPQNDIEYYWGILSQWLGGLVWTYAIGQFCGIVANMSLEKIRFQQNMDALNRMMEHKNMPKAMRFKLREYFLQARDLHMTNAYTGLLNQMSPMLQAEVAHQTNKHWLEKIWYLAECSDAFVARICCHLVAAVFCPRESVQKDARLGIISRGLVGYFGRVLRKGAVFGEDFLLKNKELRRDSALIAITYTEILSIASDTFLKFLEQASARDVAEVRWGVIRLAVMRGIPVLAEKLYKNKRLRDKFLDGARMEGDELRTPLPANMNENKCTLESKLSNSCDVVPQSPGCSEVQTQILKQQEKLDADVQEIKKLLNHVIQALPGANQMQPGANEMQPGVDLT